MNVQIVVADKSQHAPEIRELFWEHLQWANARVNEEFNFNFDIVNMLKDDMQDLEKFMPPKGRLLLCYSDDQLAGIVCLKPLFPTIVEIKRMYVRPSHRKAGLGHALVKQLLQEARDIGYQRIQLHSAGFMKDAHQLYRSMGFNEISAYEGNEIPEEFHKRWVFMELRLVPDQY